MLGVALGAVIGWLLAAVRTRSELVKSQVDAEGRVKAAESTLQEVRGAVRLAPSGTRRLARKSWAHFNRNSVKKASRRSRRKRNWNSVRSALADSNELRERLKAEGELRVAAETKLRETQASLEEQKKLLEDAKKTLTETFQALSAEALKSNNQAFIALARSTV